MIIEGLGKRIGNKLFFEKFFKFIFVIGVIVIPLHSLLKRGVK